MKAEVDAYNAEKQIMQTVNATSTLVDKKLTTKRSILCQVEEGSLLASMFSGRWEDALMRDNDSAVFLDFNPQYFVVILDYLRAKKIATAENPTALPKVSEDQLKNVNALLEYLGLVDEIVLQKKIDETVLQQFDMQSEGITLQEGGKVAINDPNQVIYMFLVKMFTKKELCVKLNMESVQNNWGPVNIHMKAWFTCMGTRKQWESVE